MNEDFNDIEFYRGTATHSFIDKKNDVRVNIGAAASLPARFDPIRLAYNNMLMGVQSCGMDQSLLDQMCNLLRLNCKSLGVELLVTKSNRPFDSQWYFYGDLEGLIQVAQRELVRTPFGSALYPDIDRALYMSRRTRG